MHHVLYIFIQVKVFLLVCTDNFFMFRDPSTNIFFFKVRNGLIKDFDLCIIVETSEVTNCVMSIYCSLIHR